MTIWPRYTLIFLAYYRIFGKNLFIFLKTNWNSANMHSEGTIFDNKSHLYCVRLQLLKKVAGNALLDPRYQAASAVRRGRRHCWWTEYAGALPSFAKVAKLRQSSFKSKEVAKEIVTRKLWEHKLKMLARSCLHNQPTLHTCNFCVIQGTEFPE